MLDAVYIEVTICSLDITKVKVAFWREKWIALQFKTNASSLAKTMQCKGQSEKVKDSKKSSKKWECNIRKTLATDRDL